MRLKKKSLVGWTRSDWDGWVGVVYEKGIGRIDHPAIFETEKEALRYYCSVKRVKFAIQELPRRMR